MASLSEQLTKYLSDAHSIETQALAQMRTAPDIAGEPGLADAFRTHLTETERHQRLVRERLDAHGGSPSKLKEAVMAVGGKGFVLFARSQTDTSGKLAAHAYSYEALELASYELLVRVAERAGDEQTAAVARDIRAEEDAMRSRVGARWDAIVDTALAEAKGDDLERHLVHYLADAHALEQQALQLLGKAPGMAGDPGMARSYEEHLEETRGHERQIRERLEAHDEGPSRLKDAAMRLGGLNWGMFFQAHPDTPGKLAAFAYAFEHLEMGGYEQLLRVARRAGDEATATLVERILGEERHAAASIAAHWDRAAEASLEAKGVATSSLPPGS
jgi:ferritin-like metal-binding protein YciE